MQALAHWVIHDLPIYSMQTILLPSSICKDLEKIQRGFIWDHSDDHRTWHTITATEVWGIISGLELAWENGFQEGLARD